MELILENEATINFVVDFDVFWEKMEPLVIVSFGTVDCEQVDLVVCFNLPTIEEVAGDDSYLF